MMRNREDRDDVTSAQEQEGPLRSLVHLSRAAASSAVGAVDVLFKIAYSIPWEETIADGQADLPEDAWMLALISSRSASGRRRRGVLLSASPVQVIVVRGRDALVVSARWFASGPDGRTRAIELSFAASSTDLAARSTFCGRSWSPPSIDMGLASSLASSP